MNKFFEEIDFEILLKLVVCLILEMVLFSAHYIIYLEALNLPDIAYLNEIPPFSYLLNASSEWTLSHIISGLFALTSVSVPIIIWGVIFKDDLLYSYQEYFANKTNFLVTGVLIFIYIVVICLEVAAFSTFLSQILDGLGGGPFGSSLNSQSSKFLDIAKENGSTFIAIGTSVLIMINAMLAWATSRTYDSINNQMNGEIA